MPRRRTRPEEEAIITVADVGEFGLIDAVIAQLPAPDPARVPVGAGDDGAVLAAPDGRVVVSTDSLVEGRHFRRDWSSATDVGHKAAAQAMADIAAMGARPTGLLVALACPPDLPLAWAADFTAGLAAECDVAGAAPVGGDVVASPTLMVAMTALGDLGGATAVRRSGARPGDLVALVGRIGWAAAGLAVLSRGFRSPAAVVGAHRRPEPPYAEGPRAAALGATSMCDVSDGLVQDVGHVAAASGVVIDVSTDQLAVPPKLVEVAAALGADPMQWLLEGGDDHPLVATFGPDVALPAEWTPIGQVLAAGDSGPGVRVDGVDRPAPGWDHFG